jgi:hypothetical protein
MTRVLIIGARRRHQGIGPYVARSFQQAGANVCAIVGTTDETASTAQQQLTEYDIDCNAYTELREALEKEEPDVVAVCSPYAKHREQLEVIAEAGAHCICEKPMWWEEPENRVEQTKTIVGAFAKRDLFFDLMTQWPCTLEQYFQLYPSLTSSTIESFEMLLGPINTGPTMIIDAAPHALSMLCALVGYGTVTDASATYLDDEHRNMRLEFRYNDVAVTCHFETCEEQPRPAWYSINGHVAHRRIELPQYTMRLTTPDDSQSVALPDPLFEHICNFLDNVAVGDETDQQRLIESISNLEILFKVG